MKGPIEYKIVSLYPDDFELGYHGSHVDFVHRPYKERSPEHRADYDKLEQSVLKNHIQKPIITFRGHILIGMRRAEIFIKHFGYFEQILCAEIQEDVYLWDRNDLPRLDELKERIGEYEYK